MIGIRHVLSGLSLFTVTAFAIGCSPQTAFRPSDGASAQFDLNESHPEYPDGDGNSPTEDGEETPKPAPSVTPKPSPSAVPGEREKPNEKPKPKMSDCPNGGTIPPAVVDALVTKYGCVDSSENGKKSNEKKISICHVPSGNPNSAHTICVAVPGAVNGHGIDAQTCKSPVGDYCGACK